MLCSSAEPSRGQRSRWVEIALRNSECNPQTQPEIGTVSALVYQLMDGRDVMVTHDRILCLLELVPSESEDRLLAVIAVYYLIKARCITRDMIEIGTVGFLLNPGYCGDMEQFCLLRLLLLTLFVFHEEISIDYHAVIARVAQVMRIVPETLFRCLLRDLSKLCSVESEYFIAMFHLSTWNIIAFCFNHSRSGVLVQRTRKLKQLATRFLIELPRDEAELWRRQLSSIRIETIIWMLWTDDHRDYFPDVLDMMRDEYPTLMERIDEEQRETIFQRAKDLFNDEGSTWRVRDSAEKFMAAFN